MAGLEVYKTGGPANDKDFEILGWSGGGILGGQSRVNKRRSVSKTFEGCGVKGPK